MRKNTSKMAAWMAGLCVAGLCLSGSNGAKWYSFDGQWPDVPQSWRFSGPYGVTVDASGNVFIADTQNHRIKKFDSSGNLLGAWGSYGAGDAQFNSPRSVAVDSSGNVFVVDTGNYRIQKFDSSENFLIKWGSHGPGDGQFGGGGYGQGLGPVGITVDASGNILVADTENHRIQKFDSSGNFLTKWGSYGSGDGKFNAPQGIVVDISGIVVVADTGNHRLQRFDASGTFLSKAGYFGSDPGKFSSPHGIAVAASGNLFVADTGNQRVQRLDATGNPLATWGTAGSAEGKFDSPRDIAVDASGNILVADTGNDRIQKFDPSGNFLARWGYRGSADGEFNRPGTLTVGSSGSVFVVDTGNYRVQTFDTSGNFLGKWGSKGSGNGQFEWPFVSPPGIAVDAWGNVLVADTGNARIQKFDSGGNFLNKWSYYDPDDGGPPMQPYGIAVDSSGDVFVTDAEHCRVRQFDSSGNFLNKWGSLGSGSGEFNLPRGIAVDSSGNVFVADTGNHRIQKFDSSRVFVAEWGAEGSGDGEFRSPHGIAVDSSGHVFVADTDNHRVQEFDSSGRFLAQWGSEGSGDGEFRSPRGIAVDSSGNVFVADTGNHRIQKFRRLQPMIAAQPDSLSNTCFQGEDALSQSLEVWNSSGATLYYTIADNVAWLSCDPTSGSSDGEHDTIAVTYSTSDLEQGTYHATITVSGPDASNSPQHIAVTLTVRSSVAAIACQPLSLLSVCDQGQNALPKNFDVWNAGGGTLSYTITDDVAWLFCSPSIGTSTGEHDTVRVTYNTPGLEPGSYSARITVSAPGISNSPQYVDVTLIVRSRPAAIRHQPTSLTNYCDEEQNARPQNFELWNTGGGILSYRITEDAEWLSCSPAIGTSSGEHDMVTVSYETATLAPGTYSATITLSDPDAANSPQTIPVNLTVHPIDKEGTLRAGSETMVQGDPTLLPVPISLDLPFDLTYLAMTVEFQSDFFSAVDYAEAGRVGAEPSAEGIDNDAGTVRIVWLNYTGETTILAGSGPIATIQFKQKTGVTEGTYPLTLSGVEATYGPQNYHLEWVNGQIEVLRGTLDVDLNGAVEAATDIVYIYRCLTEMPTIVPSRFREIDPSIPPEDEIKARIDALKPMLDVDASGGDADPATDIVYIHRYLAGMPRTVPTAFRQTDPSIPPDEEINARIDTINLPGSQKASPQSLFITGELPACPLGSARVASTSSVLRIASVAGKRGESIAVTIVLYAPDDDLTFLRFWMEYDTTRLSPTLLHEVGRTTAEPMSDWLDKENGRIRAVVESLQGDVVIPRGTGAVLEIVFDVLEDTTSSDSLHVYGNVEAGFGPKKVSVTILRPAVIGLTPSAAVSLTWQPFGGGSYTVQSCDDLLAGNWAPVAGTDWPIAETSWQGEPMTNVGRQFYRVKSE